jgi:hypothetical protein
MAFHMWCKYAAKIRATKNMKNENKAKTTFLIVFENDGQRFTKP